MSAPAARNRSISSIARAWACVRIRPLIAEASRGVSGRGHQRRDAVHARQIDERAVLEQQAGRVDVGADGGAQQRRRAGVQQLVGEAAVVAAAARPMHVELSVRIDAGLEQQTDDVRWPRSRTTPSGATAGRERCSCRRRRRAPCVRTNPRRAGSRLRRASSARRVVALLSIAIISGVMPSGVGLSMSAPAASSERTQRVQPERAAYSSTVSPPTGRYCARGSAVICESQSLAEARTFTSAPLIDQELRELGEVAVDGPDQRRLIAPGLFCVDVGAALDEQLGDVERAHARREHQCGLAVAVRRFDVGAGVEQLRRPTPSRRASRLRRAGSSRTCS